MSSCKALDPILAKWLDGTCKIPIIIISTCSRYPTMVAKGSSVIGGGTRALAPKKFISVHRNLVFHNRNVSC